MRERQASVRGLREKKRRVGPGMQPAGPGSALDMRAQAARAKRVRDTQAASPGTVPDSQGTGLTEGRESQEAGRGNGPGTQAKEKVPGRQPGIWGLVRLAAAHTAGPMQGRKNLASLRAETRPLEEQ